MKKTFLALLLILALMLVLSCFAACETESGEVQPLETENPGDKTTEGHTEKTTEAHVCVFGDWATVKDANCTESGSRERACDCGEKETEVIAAIGHDEVMHDAQAPSCTEVGWDAYVTCTRCNHTTYSEIAALEHDIVQIAEKEPTCTECPRDV